MFQESIEKAELKTPKSLVIYNHLLFLTIILLSQKPMNVIRFVTKAI